jgi:hypothetical protein
MIDPNMFYDRMKAIPRYTGHFERGGYPIDNEHGMFVLANDCFDLYDMIVNEIIKVLNERDAEAK